MTTETNTADEKGNTVWIPLFDYGKHKQTAGHLQRPTYCCEDYLKKKNKKIKSSSWLPIYSPNWGLSWQHKQLSISLFQNTRYECQQDSTKLVTQIQILSAVTSSYKKGRGRKELEMGHCSIKQKTVTDHFTKFQLCLTSSIESAHFAQWSFELMSTDWSI